jgi:penicillin-binding protein 2
MEASRTRTVFVGAIVVFLFAALLSRLWFLQVVEGPELSQEARAQGVRVVFTDAPRGRILDRNGHVLVDNRIARAVTVDRDIYRDLTGTERNELMARLSEVLGVRKSRLERRMNSDQYDRLRPVPVADDVSEADAIRISEHLEDFPGVEIDLVPVRTYPYGETAAHVLGYAAEISDDELAARASAGYHQGDLIGKTGVEAAYEVDLRGERGEVPLLVDADGRVIGQVGEEVPSSAGSDVYLTLDIDIQRTAEAQLAEQMELAHSTCVDRDACPGPLYNAPVGCVVVLDAHTGDVVAMASNPTYDPAVFVDGISGEELEALNNEENHYPLFNYCTQGEYAPGSVWKPITALAGLRAGVINLGDTIPDPTGCFVYGNNDDRYCNYGRQGYGRANLYQALVKSVNVFFYQVGAWLWAETAPDVDEMIQQVAREFGFDQPTGIELSERDGRVPDQAWLTEAHELYPDAFPNDTWLGGYTVHLAIGQSELLVTPLQLARAYAGIATGDTLPVPHLGGEITAPGDPTDVRREIQPEPGHVQIDPAQHDLIMSALRGVVANSGSGDGFTGTAFTVFDGQFPLAQYPVAGKTGTAQRTGHQSTSLFAGVLPADGTEYVVVSVVEEGGTGGTTAAPIVRDVMRVMIGEDPPPPDPVEAAEAAEGATGPGAIDVGEGTGTAPADTTTTTVPVATTVADTPSGRRIPSRRRDGGCDAGAAPPQPRPTGRPRHARYPRRARGGSP